ncbi:VOC family protein [Streptomyces mirabilis]|uniref:VOC family protein n=1 Tax=Streptomyces mirabilis TaxID=68239 RepID=UPI0033334C48
MQIRERGEAMISGLHHYALSVPDLAQGEEFLQTFGLETFEKEGALVGRCTGRDQDQVRMVEGPHKQLHHMAFTVAADGVDALRESLERHGVPLIEPLEGASGEGLWIRDPDGTAVQLIPSAQAQPRPVPRVDTNVGGQYNRLNQAAWREMPQDVAPRRLGHSLVFTAQPENMTAFYTDVLGLRLSDRIKDKVTFLNAGPGDHHVFGFITSTHPGFHHASFEVPSIDAIAVGADRWRSAGRPTGWGLGRHTIGSNFFHYNPDPWGSWIEWFSDIDQIDDCWVAGEWEVPPHLWGTPPPEKFTTNLEAPRADS